MMKISLRKGTVIKYGGVDMKVVSVPDFEHVTVQGADGHYLTARISDLETERAGKVTRGVTHDPTRQDKVVAYKTAFGPLLDKEGHTTAEVRAAAAQVGISMASAYRALARYERTGTVADLPPPTRPGGRGKSRITAPAEEIIQKAIDGILLNSRNFSNRNFMRTVKLALEKAKLKVAASTLRRRVARIPEYKLHLARKGHAETRRTHDPLKGSAPELAKPLAQIQIDHWFADILIVGDDRLESIGRVWITVGIDVYSRMIWGVHVSLDPPGTTTLGMMMISGMTRKEKQYGKYDLKLEMPIAGKPEEVRADNAGEFAGKAMEASCKHFNIKLSLRPVESPQYGGHIERLNGTLAQKFKDLPGATGPSTKGRKHLKPEKTAAFTLEDLTKHVWLLISEYHNEVHMGVKMTPIEKYKSYFFGELGQKRNLPDVYPDTQDFRREWYPMKLCSIQRYGIRIQYLDYYNENIEQLVRNRKGLPKVKVRRNPYDVREVFVEHPTTREWIPLPVRQITFPVAAIFELQTAARQALKEKRAPTPEALAEIILQQRKHIEEVEKKTKTAQRAASRRSHHERIRQQTKPIVADDARDIAAGVESRVTILSPVPGEPKPEAPPRLRPAQVSSPKFEPPARQDSDLAAILAAITDDDIDGHFDD